MKDGDDNLPKLPDPNESLKKLQGASQSTSSKWDQAHLQDHVQEGRFCGRCRHFVDKAKGHEELRRDQFWERCFKYHGDGTDWKLRHIGNPEDYSICNKRGCATHQHSTCEFWELG